MKTSKRKNGAGSVLANLAGMTMLAAVAVGLTCGASSAQGALIGFNAEDGSSATTTASASLGADFDPALSDVDALGGQYITSETDYASTTEPGNAEKVASYTVNFDTTGDYDLYAKLLAKNADEDSFYVGNGFGAKDPTVAADWKTINGLNYIDGTTAIRSDYTWVNITDFGGLTAYNVAAAGNQTFEIGGREDGLRIDAFAFGTSGDTFTDSQLDAAVIPEPASLGLFALVGGLLWFVRRRVRA